MARPMWSFRQGSPRLAAASDKLFRGCQDFRYQLGRCGLGIGAKQRLGSGSAEQYPCFGSFAVCRRIQEKLDAIEIFFFQNTVAPQTLRCVGTRPLNRSLLDLFRNVQIASAIEVRTELVLQIRDQLAKWLALLRH